LRLLAASTGMMEIRSWGGHHKHVHPYPRSKMLSKSKGGKGSERALPSSERTSREFAQQRITVAAAHHDACLGKTAARSQQDLKISLRCDVIRSPLKILGKGAVRDMEQAILRFSRALACIRGCCSGPLSFFGLHNHRPALGKSVDGLYSRIHRIREGQRGTRGNRCGSFVWIHVRHDANCNAC